MEKNESKSDRLARAFLAVIFLLLGTIVFTGALSVVAYVLAIIMLVTAMTGFCGLYKMLNINTKRDSE